MFQSGIGLLWVLCLMAGQEREQEPEQEKKEEEQQRIKRVCFPSWTAMGATICRARAATTATPMPLEQAKRLLSSSGSNEMAGWDRRSSGSSGCFGFSFCLFNGFMNYQATPVCPLSPSLPAPFAWIDKRISSRNLTPCAQISLDAPSNVANNGRRHRSSLRFPMSSMTIKTSVVLSTTPSSPWFL